MMLVPTKRTLLSTKRMSVVHVDHEHLQDEEDGAVSGQAAERAGLATVPCWVREYSDADAYMQLVLCNTQSELHALEEGKHAAESGMELKAYAKVSGKKQTTLFARVAAYRVMADSDIGIDDAQKTWSNLAEIHAAPEWLWPALVSQMVGDSWTSAETLSANRFCNRLFRFVFFLNLRRSPHVSPHTAHG